MVGIKPVISVLQKICMDEIKSPIKRKIFRSLKRQQNLAINALCK